MVLLTLNFDFRNRINARYYSVGQRQPQDKIGCAGCECNNEWRCRHAKYGKSQKNLINISGQQTVFNAGVGQNEGKFTHLTERKANQD